MRKIEAKAVPNSGLKPLNIDGESVFIKKKGQDFRILQLTDIHYGRGFLSINKDKMAHNAVVTLVERIKPDLIIVTGDLVYPVPVFSGSFFNLHESKYVGKLFESFNIPWTLTFGNHDCEPFATHKKESLLKFYNALPNCLINDGAPGVSGVGNHSILIKNEDGTINNALFMLDSNMYLKRSFFSGFDNIHDDQIEWYKNTVKKLSGAETVKSLAFFHMPVKEFRDAWEKLKGGNRSEVKYHCGTIGEKNDYIGYSRKKEGHFFEEMVKLDSCKGIFCGHDHYNNISMTYKGIRLTYGMSIDFLAYRKIHKRYTQRGGTVISIHDDGSFNVKHEALTHFVHNIEDFNILSKLT